MVGADVLGGPRPRVVPAVVPMCIPRRGRWYTWDGAINCVPPWRQIDKNKNKNFKMLLLADEKM